MKFTKSMGIAFIITFIFVAVAVFGVQQLRNMKIPVIVDIEGTLDKDFNLDQKENALGVDGTDTDAAIKEDEKKIEIKEPIKVRGLYLTGWTVGDMNRVNSFVNLANETEINAYVIDIKDEDGKVGYRSEVPKVLELGTWQWKFNPDAVIEEFKKNDIYLIGRLVVNKDPIYAEKNQQHAIRHVNGSVWRDPQGRAWIDPYEREAWPYHIEIAREAIDKGFDEIQFDYIRFANDGNSNLMDFSRHGNISRHEIIDQFLDFARNELPDVVFSADVFGIICESPGDTERIGQNLDTIGKNIHYLSPMVYPSHYANGQIVNGVPFPKPDLEPYDVVYQSLVKANERISEIPDYMAGMRPYLQDFTASWLGAGNYKKYGADELRAQINAVYDAGYDEWLVWNANNRYSIDAFDKLAEIIEE
jgi:hypothetical protein